MLASQLKAIVAGFVAAAANIAAQPNVRNGWGVFWTAVVSYVAAHVLVYLVPNKES
jgi:hypothetical protein